MKKIRVSLVFSAVLLATLGALASRYNNELYFELKYFAGDAYCIQRIVPFVCSTNYTGIICATAYEPTIQLRLLIFPEMLCGPELWRQP